MSAPVADESREPEEPLEHERFNTYQVTCARANIFRD